MYKHLKSKELAIFFLLFWIPMTTHLFSQLKEYSTNEKLEYKIDVNAQVIPFFAVDKEGDPVYNLEEKDIELFINKKPFPITAFSRYKFESEQSQIKNKMTPIEYPERFVFFIIDSVFNSEPGLRRSKTICEKIMQSGSPGDAFILLENTPEGGLYYVHGPEKDKKKLAKAMKGISKQNQGNKELSEAERNLKRARSKIAGFTDAGSRGGNREFSRISQIQFQEVIRYQNDLQMAILQKKNSMKRFNRAISSLRYALRTITASKIVYLISEGIPYGVISKD